MRIINAKDDGVTIKLSLPELDLTKKALLNMVNFDGNREGENDKLSGMAYLLENDSIIQKYYGKEVA